MAGAIAISAAANGNAVAWIAPTYKNSRPLWRFAESAVLPCVGRGVELNKSEREITFSGGGWLGVYSADNIASILGNAFNLALIDEAARVTEEAWAEAIQPTLADYDGDAILISTPKGRNWFWREWMRGRQGDKEYASFTAPSSANPNPNIKRAALMARDRVPERTYRQEWLAEFIEDGGGVFRNVRASATAPPASYRRDGRYYFGVDWGRSNDYTVIDCINSVTGEQVAHERFTDIGYQVQVNRLVGLYERWKPETILAESNSMGAPLIEQLQGLGLPVTGFHTDNASKKQIIEGLQLAFERGKLKILNDETAISELEAYEQETLRSGLIRYSAPEGLHDDCVMALALAWHAAMDTGEGFAFSYMN